MRQIESFSTANTGKLRRHRWIDDALQKEFEQHLQTFNWMYEEKAFTEAWNQHQKLIEEAITFFIKYDKAGVTKILFGYDAVQNFRLDINALRENNVYDVLSAIAYDAYIAKDYYPAYAMYGLMLTLFPLQIQPYLMIARIEGMNHGVQKELDIYEALFKVFKNPMLSFFAANLYFQQKNFLKSKELLLDAKKLCESYDNFKPMLGKVIGLLEKIKLIEGVN